MNLLFKIDKAMALDISGLAYIPDFITQDEEQSLIQNIDNEPWLNDLKRRVQHYGYKYDYKARSATDDSYLGPLPSWLSLIAQKLKVDQIFSAIPDQVIVNEYKPGQGISAHIDCIPCFDDVIASLSLSSPCVMQFAHPQSGERQDIFLEERSLIVLSGAARYEWTHSIPARKADIIDGFKFNRSRRISLTFRNMNFL